MGRFFGGEEAASADGDVAASGRGWREGGEEGGSDPHEEGCEDLVGRGEVVRSGEERDGRGGARYGVGGEGDAPAAVDEGEEVELAPEWTTRARDWVSQGSTNSMVAGARDRSSSESVVVRSERGLWKNTVDCWGFIFREK